MTSLADGDLRVEQRKDARDWNVVAQTKPPPEETDKSKSKERISDARH